MSSQSKIVVFDLDETLGYFPQLSMLWEIIRSYLLRIGQHEVKKRPTTSSLDISIDPSLNHSLDLSLDLSHPGTMSQNYFGLILDLYPEFIRPNILSILNYIKYKKESGECMGVMIYTNNQGPKYWVKYIQEYFERKMKYELFDQTICAFKVNGQRLELFRTSHSKTVDDLIKCTKIPTGTLICFLDDVVHPEMIKENVYYIKIKPYVHWLVPDLLIQRFIHSEVGEELISREYRESFLEYASEYIKNHPMNYVEKSTEDYEIDKIVTKKTMVHLQIFFEKRADKIDVVRRGKNKSRNRREFSHRKTRRPLI